jgi:hypothetical protein
LVWRGTLLRGILEIHATGSLLVASQWLEKQTINSDNILTMLAATRSVNKVTLNKHHNAHCFVPSIMASIMHRGRPEDVEPRLASANGSKVALVGDNSGAILRAGEYILYGLHNNDSLLVGQMIDALC